MPDYLLLERRYRYVNNVRMNMYRRRVLPHDPPWWLDPTREAFFVTVCCIPRGLNQLAKKGVWDSLLETVRVREERGDWRWTLLLAMPDHLHGLVQFPQRFFLRKTMGNWKRWTARSIGIEWQDGFFDHRLRSWESAEEKRSYILRNPVRAGLVDCPENWPYLLDRR